MKPPAILAAAILSTAQLAFGIQPKVAELNFDSAIEKPDALAEANAPEWITRVEHLGGEFLDAEHCWHVAPKEKEGVGRLILNIDRQRLNENLVATILFDADETGDIAVQLLDGQGRVVVVDVFGNLVEVGNEATTDTFVIPLRKYPTAEKIVVRRITGDIKVYGIVLFPVVTEAVVDTAALQELANVLGDPLSPENPLVKSLQQVAKSGKVAIQPIKPPTPKPTVSTVPTPPPVREKYAGATPPPAGMKVAPAPTNGLVAHLSFDSDFADASGRNRPAIPYGALKMEPGVFGKALRLQRTAYQSAHIAPTPDLDLRGTLTMAAWVNYSSIAPRWGSQIVWHGDSQLGRDPWLLHIYPSGTVDIRSDRSITGKPIFQVFGDEIQLSAKGVPEQSQHVAVNSPKVLAPNTWYFVAGSIEQTTDKTQTFRLYVNGEEVGNLKTDEVVNYDLSGMWTTIGAVDKGGWQHFDGLIDDVRVYNRALTPAEVKTLYHQPRK